jgi:hypothetical protein
LHETIRENINICWRGAEQLIHVHLLSPTGLQNESAATIRDAEPAQTRIVRRPQAGLMRLPLSAKSWIERAAIAAAGAGAVYYAGAFLFVAFSRIGYPFSLEWLEGGSFAQVQRILTGQPLYARPSIDYVAMIYPPLYYYSAAIVARLLGLNFFSLRLVSLISSLGCILLIWLIIRQNGSSALPALVGAGMFAASYALSGSWYDIARVDMLSLALLLCSTWLLRLGRTSAHVASGLVFALACLTKQTHLITLAVISLYLLVFERRKLPAFSLSCLTSIGAAYFLLDRLYAGWFRFFVLKLALGSGEYVNVAPATSLETALDFWAGSIALALPVACLLIAAHVLEGFRQPDRAAGLHFYLACAVGMMGTSWAVIQVGGYKNDLVPAYAILAILFGLSLQEFAYKQPVSLTLRTILFTACAIQFAALHYPIAAQIPSAADLQAGRELVAEIHAQPGPVYVPFHPELTLMAGKAPFASWSPMYQLEGNFGGGDLREAGRVKTEFSHAMARRQFGMILLDQDPNWIWGDPDRYYFVSSEPVFKDPHVFWPVTGWQTRPRLKMFAFGG